MAGPHHGASAGPRVARRTLGVMILLVAATEAELCGFDGVVCGVGPVEAGIATARALAMAPVDAVLHVGLAGGPELGTLVLGSEASYLDLEAEWPVIDRVEADPLLLEVAQTALPQAVTAPIMTSATVGRATSEVVRDGGPVEAMEGFAVLRAAAIAGVPALEVRAVSNVVGEGDRARWRVTEALAALATALPVLVHALSEELTARER